MKAIATAILALTMAVIYHAEGKAFAGWAVIASMVATVAYTFTEKTER